MSFFLNDTATTEIYTLPLHDALPISQRPMWEYQMVPLSGNGLRCIAYDRRGHGGSDDPERGHDHARHMRCSAGRCRQDPKSTRLNSSHQILSYAVFFLKKKNK